MTRFLDEERAPLEMGQGSKNKKLFICPECKTGRYSSINTIGFICSRCNKYIRVSDCINIEPEDMLNNNKIIDPNYIKFREEKEKSAYDFRDKVLKDRKNGIVRSHEPNGEKRNW